METNITNKVMKKFLVLSLLLSVGFVKTWGWRRFRVSLTPCLVSVLVIFIRVFAYLLADVANVIFFRNFAA